MSKITSHVADSTSASSTPSFGVIQPDAGTSPTADQANDTLTLTSSDAVLLITGNAATDTVDFTKGLGFNEFVQDAIGNSFIVAGTGLTATYTDPSNFITISLDSSYASSLILSSGGSLFVRRPGDYMHGQLGFTTSTGASACIFAHSNQDGSSTDLDIIRFGANVDGLNPGIIAWSNPGEGNNAVEFRTSALTYLNTLAQNVTALGTVQAVGLITGPSLIFTGGSGSTLTLTNDLIVSGASSEILMPNATTSSGGILLGGDARLFRGAADRFETPDSLHLNGGFLGVGTAPSSTNQIYSRFSGTAATAVSAMYGEVIYTASSSPSGQRPRALNFVATQAGAVNYTDSLGATGFEGLAGTTSSLTSEGVCGGIVGARNQGTGTLVRAAGLLVLGAENSGGGNVTNTRGIDVAGPATFTANSQTRIGVRVGTNASNGASFSGSVAASLQFNSTSRGSQDGILWSTDTNLFSSAADELKTEDTFFVGGGLKLSRVRGASTQTLGSTHVVVGVDTNAARTITLPATSSHNSRTYWIGDETGLANTNPITIGRTGASDLIAGSTLLVINTSRGWVCLNSNGQFFWDRIGVV